MSDAGAKVRSAQKKPKKIFIQKNQRYSRASGRTPLNSLRLSEKGLPDDKTLCALSSERWF